MFKRLYREFFYIPKYAKMTDKVFKGRISLSVLTMIACCVLFCATTFAWFNSLQNTTVSPIVAADYSLSVEVNGRTLNTNEYTCPLSTEDRHVFTITATGTASTGYCKITVNGQTYTTVSISNGMHITLTVVAAQGEEISFSAHWGAYSGEGCYEDGAVINISNTPYQIYAVPENITLEQIAEHYNVSASDILLYNGISEITAGTEIRIPNTAVTEPLVISEEPTVAATEPAADSEPEAKDEITPTAPAQNESVPVETNAIEPVETVAVNTDPTVTSETADAETEDSSQTE